MSIPFWRNKKYTDDGCCIYQCLSCYQTWEARTSPYSEEHCIKYEDGFKYCPYCGIKWEGEIKQKEDHYDFKASEIKEKKYKEREDKKHWWVLVAREKYDDRFKPLYRVEAGGRYPAKAIRNWFLSNKEYYLNSCYTSYVSVELIFSKDLAKDFPRVCISEERSKVLRHHEENK